MFKRSYLLLLLLVIVTVSCCWFSASVIEDPSICMNKNNKNNQKKRLNSLCRLIFCSCCCCCCCYCVILLLFMFKSSYVDKMQCQHTSLVETYGSHELYYIRSSWHSEACNWEFSGQLDVLPSRGIWWPWAVLCKVIVTLWIMQLRIQWTVRGTPQ